MIGSGGKTESGSVSRAKQGKKKASNGRAATLKFIHLGCSQVRDKKRVEHTRSYISHDATTAAVLVWLENVHKSDNASSCSCNLSPREVIATQESNLTSMHCAAVDVKTLKQASCWTFPSIL